MRGALFANIAHGIITGLLFFLAGAIKDRHDTSDLRAIGRALYARLPRIGALLTFACLASLGLPGLAGFWGEMLVLLGAYRPGDWLAADDVSGVDGDRRARDRADRGVLPPAGPQPLPG